MKPNFTLTIPKPCHENWKDFKPTKQGGFCASCQKEVIDFTAWTDEEIKQYFMRAAGTTCGKFRPQQLKTYQEPRSKPGSPWRLAALLTLLSLWFGKPSLAQASKGKAVYSVVDEKKCLVTSSDTLIARIAVTGQVKDDQGVAMPGVNVVRKGTTLGAVSDVDGKFLLEINRPNYNETLVFSFIGMVTKEVSLTANTSQKELDIVLQTDQTQLSEVVVIAGGVCAVRRFTPRWLWWKVRGIFPR